jgi:hypothetical protein
MMFALLRLTKPHQKQISLNEVSARAALIVTQLVQSNLTIESDLGDSDIPPIAPLLQPSPAIHISSGASLQTQHIDKPQTPAWGSSATIGVAPPKLPRIPAPKTG